MINIRSKGPAVVLSHTGLKSVCPSARNADDKTVRRISEVGGLIGVALFRPALCEDDSVHAFVKAVRKVVEITGHVKSVSLGSDWDGSVGVQITSDRVHILSAALMDLGNFTKQEVECILFTNVNSFFQRVLPSAAT